MAENPTLIMATLPAVYVKRFNFMAKFTHEAESTFLMRLINARFNELTQDFQFFKGEYDTWLQKQ